MVEDGVGWMVEDGVGWMVEDSVEWMVAEDVEWMVARMLGGWLWTMLRPAMGLSVGGFANSAYWRIWQNDPAAVSSVCCKQWLRAKHAREPFVAKEKETHAW